jgi:gas vesicle protein
MEGIMLDGQGSGRFGFLLVGAGIGAALALLFAPKAGREVREDIRDAGRQGLDLASERVKTASDAANDYYQSGVRKAGEMYQGAMDKISQTATAISEQAARSRQHVEEAVQTGKDAYAKASQS